MTEKHFWIDYTACEVEHTNLELKLYMQIVLSDRLFVTRKHESYNDQDPAFWDNEVQYITDPRDISIDFLERRKHKLESLMV